MTKQLLSRHTEKTKLLKLLNSDKSELIAVYGRRRIGKTFLVSSVCQHVDNCIRFDLSGELDANSAPVTESQFLLSFNIALYDSLGVRKDAQSAKDCLMALVDLKNEAERRSKKLILFFDELPWLALSAPEFFQAFVTLWNNSLAKSPLVKLVVAGSATSWMMEKVIQAKTGLAKRVTGKIYLEAFDLLETREFLWKKGFEDLTSDQLIQYYSAIGGIPYYLESLDGSLSTPQNLYNLLVSRDGILGGEDEYNQLFRYLFNTSEHYEGLVSFIATKKYGVTQSEIARLVEKSKKLSTVTRSRLKDLMYSDLVSERPPLLNKKRGARYFVTDEYIRFYTKWLKDKRYVDFADFNQIFDSPSFRSWQGFDFELTVFKNYQIVVKSLGLAGISVVPHVFYASDGVQIDLLLLRSDNTVTLCEAKSVDREYELSADDIAKFRRRRDSIRELYKSKRKPQPNVDACYIVRNGIKKNGFFKEMHPLVVDLGEVL